VEFGESRAHHGGFGVDEQNVAEKKLLQVLHAPNIAR